MNNESYILAQIQNLDALLKSLMSEVYSQTHGDTESEILPPLVTIDGGGGGVWSGYYKWGGEFFGGPELLESIDGRYFGVDLKDPSVTHWADEPDEMVPDVEWSYVADKIILNEGTPDEEIVYSLSSRTCGDIVIRSV